LHCWFYPIDICEIEQPKKCPFSMTMKREQNHSKRKLLTVKEKSQKLGKGKPRNIASVILF
jgi:hypothetical protein